MTQKIPRMRMFAGPNGSGKSTVKYGLQRPSSWFGIYINPDELEKTIRETGMLTLDAFGMNATSDEIRAHFDASTFLKNRISAAVFDRFKVRAGVIDFGGVEITSYHASVLSDFLRRTAIESSMTFSFETVMSSPDKVELLGEARRRNLRTYLYYVATEDPEINIQRVKTRVMAGGHDVPTDKIVSRYHRSLKLLSAAIPHTDRAYFFDTSARAVVFR